jgi:broad specificity phosphatase PhoE
MACRIRKALQNIYEQYITKNILVVTHGGSIRLAIMEALKLPSRHYPFIFENTSITELVYKENRWWLSRMNDASHLELL